MYSPKVPEIYIPVLYKCAKARKLPMTRLVAEAIDLYLKQTAASDPISLDDGWVVTDQGRESQRQPGGLRRAR